MNPVLFFINYSPYYDKKVAEEGEDSKNPNADLKRFVLHEVVTAGELISRRITSNSFHGFLSVTTKDETI